MKPARAWVTELPIPPAGCPWPEVRNALSECAPMGAVRVVVVPQAENLLEKPKELPAAVRELLVNPLPETRLLLVSRSVDEFSAALDERGVCSFNCSVEKDYAEQEPLRSPIRAVKPYRVSESADVQRVSLLLAAGLYENMRGKTYCRRPDSFRRPRSLLSAVHIATTRRRSEPGRTCQSRAAPTAVARAAAWLGVNPAEPRLPHEG